MGYCNKKRLQATGAIREDLIEGLELELVGERLRLQQVKGVPVYGNMPNDQI